MASLFLFLVALPYLAPTGIAAYRDHRSQTALFLLNLLLGWTIIGWVAAFVWALAGEKTAYRVAAAGDEVGPRSLRLQGRDPRA